MAGSILRRAMSPQVIQSGIVYIGGLWLSICVHEWGHAYVADRLGDPLPRAQGRVTLNPLAHMDPLGTVLLPIVAFIMSATNPEIGSRILGWGKPVQVSLSARSLTRRWPVRVSHMMISAAGPAMNMVFAMFISALYVGLVKVGSEGALKAATIAQGLIGMNFGLAFFNLLPLPPLDGGSLAINLLPRKLGSVGEAIERYGSIVLFMLLMSGLLGYLMLPARHLAVLWTNKLTLFALTLR